ncbi:hypothetical protein QLX08_009555 [Tetragonisca angustula]|uniref:Uncharacterized protein n=1 Tax=Tetragonisca angustula TaxID=166442 RepID=A0AAW0ZIB9_9HYME
MGKQQSTTWLVDAHGDPLFSLSATHNSTLRCSEPSRRSEDRQASTLAAGRRAGSAKLRSKTVARDARPRADDEIRANRGKLLIAAAGTMRRALLTVVSLRQGKLLVAKS